MTKVDKNLKNSLPMVADFPHLEAEKFPLDSNALTQPPKGHGILFILSAPAGCGKTTLIQKLCREFSNIRASVSSTTRLPRMGEVDGVDYHFLTQQQFEEGIANGRFFEYVTLFGNYYGTSKDEIFSLLAKGIHVFLVIDINGAQQIQLQTHAVTIFLKPPSLEVLRSRLQKRGSETQESLDIRLARAKDELAFESHYQYTLVNDTLELAYHKLRSIVIAECLKTKYMKE